jgi:hypothetical protein
MKTIKYGYIGEDEAQAKFLESILSKIIQYFNLETRFEFKKDEEYFTFITPLLRSQINRENINDLSRNVVDSNFIPFAVFGLIDYQQDVFFVIRDVDSTRFEKLEKMYQERIEQIIYQKQKNTSSSGLFSEEKIIIILPIHCIETWYMYEKWRRNKHHDQVLEDKFEMFGREVKNQFYGSRPNSQKKKNEIDEYSKSLNIDFLKANSESFRHFLTQIEAFLKQIQ